VVGGSIGGLTAALLLRDAGWDVAVFERSAAVLEGRGGGIVLHPATIRYLVERRHATPEEMGIAVSRLRYLDSAGGIAHESPCSYRFTSYDVVYRRLLTAFGPERYELGGECVGVDDSSAGLSLELSSGRLVPADLAVFADGINSFGRSLVAPGADLEYAGYVAWRGTVDEGLIEPDALDVLAGAITYQVLPAGHVITYPIPEHDRSTRSSRLRNWLWYWNVPPGAELDELLAGEDGSRFTTSVPRGRVPRDRVGELARRATACLPPALAELVSATPDPFIQVILDVAVDRMAKGRMCLIGDAAFTARPHIAAGTAKAAEDGFTLAAALDGAGDIPQALVPWSRRQTALGTSAVTRSREAGTRLQNGAWPVGKPLPYGLYRVGDSAFAGD